MQRNISTIYTQLVDTEILRDHENVFPRSRRRKIDYQIVSDR